MGRKKEETVMTPRIHETVFIAEGAKIYGDVEVGAGSSIWFNTVIRGDEGSVIIGENTNIQDNVVVHSDDGTMVKIGNGVTVGHGAVIRSCRIGNCVMVGSNATIMSHAEIGDHSVVGANSFVPYQKSFSEGSVVVGIPAKHLRNVHPEETSVRGLTVTIYASLVKAYREGKVLGIANSRHREGL